MIAGLALMIQCYLITEDDNEKFTSDNEVFQWLAAVLECAADGKLHRGLEFSAAEVVQVTNVTFLTFTIVAECIFLSGRFSPVDKRLKVLDS